MYGKSVWAIAVLWSLGLCLPARAQTAINGVVVSTAPPGPHCIVDGQDFSGTSEFMWPAGSTLTYYCQNQTSLDGRTQYTFVNVTTNLGTPPGAISADPALQWVQFNFNTAYALDLSLCAGCGQVSINGTVYNSSARIWVTAAAVPGSTTPQATVRALASPASGEAFMGWGPVPGFSPNPTAFAVNFTMTGPVTLQPVFAPTRPVAIATLPPGFQILADQTPYFAPVSMQWASNTVHTVGSTPSQLDGMNQLWVFSSWSDGGAINHSVTIGSSAISLTATFVPGANVFFSTSPPGLALVVDGGQSRTPSSFAWSGGSTHTVMAPATQNDSTGRKYQFSAWSNGKPAGFTYTMTQPPVNDSLTAVYQVVAQTTVTSAPAGLALQVNGAPCNTPCTLETPVGAQIQISAPATMALSANSRLAFQGWGDSNDATRTVSAVADPKTYTATYATQNRLSASVQPAAGASLTAAPGSSDGFYNAGTPVSIAANPALGYAIASWTGDATGMASSVALVMDAPKNVTLQLNSVPAIMVQGIRSAASAASPDSVAPGSLISIFGANLAPGVMVGPVSPLAQTLENVTVRVDDTFLPLVFASPTQINAQLVSGLAPGAHTLILRWEGKPETSAPIAVASNAPGLFSTDAPDHPWGYFVRPDGGIVTTYNPAQPGDMLTVLGTGLGPYQTTPPDGFLFGEADGYVLVDPVTVILGDATEVNPLYAGRSAVGVGVDGVRFQLPVGLPAASFLPVRILINGKESNTVFLPLAH